MSRVALTILWPSFLMAGVLEAIVFASVDPADLRFEQLGMDLSTQAVYTLAFFVFWAVLSTSGAITALLQSGPEQPHDDAIERWPH